MSFLLQFAVTSGPKRREIKDMDLPFFFFRDKIGAGKTSVFTPVRQKWIEYFGGMYRDLFDEDRMFYLLLSLDFRRRTVRMFGNREAWLNRFSTSWRSLEPFAAYYKMLLRTKDPVLKQKIFF